jgi:hypothetical protein
VRRSMFGISVVTFRKQQQTLPVLPTEPEARAGAETLLESVERTALTIARRLEESEDELSDQCRGLEDAAGALLAGVMCRVRNR